MPLNAYSTSVKDRKASKKSEMVKMMTKDGMQMAIVATSEPRKRNCL